MYKGGPDSALGDLTLSKRQETVWFGKIRLPVGLQIIGADRSIITGAIKYRSESRGVCVVWEKRQSRTVFKRDVGPYFPAILSEPLEIPKLEMRGRHIRALQDAIDTAGIKIREGITRSPGLARCEFNSTLDLAVEVLHFGGPFDQSAKF
jgi:hypothetical protein